MGKSIKKLAGVALPVAASLIPGIGPVAAAGLGAAGGALSGGGLKGALLGGVTSGIGNSLASGALSDTLVGRGLSSVADGLGDTMLGRGVSSVLGGLKGALSGGTPIDMSGGISMARPLGNTLSDAAKAAGLSGTGSSTLSGLTKYAQPLSTVFSGYQSSKAQDDVKKQLLAAQQRSEAALDPLLNSSFEPGDLTQDPGYKFNLEQGEQALGRRAAASGNYFSGQALKAAQDYGQGLANNTYNTAYQRFLNDRGQKAGIAGQLTDVYDNQGNIAANNTVGKSNILNSTLSSLLGGSGALNVGTNGVIQSGGKTYRKLPDGSYEEIV